MAGWGDWHSADKPRNKCRGRVWVQSRGGKGKTIGGGKPGDLIETKGLLEKGFLGEVALITEPS